jgi:hypothetical protein
MTKLDYHKIEYCMPASIEAILNKKINQCNDRYRLQKQYHVASIILLETA